jgi:urease accessory protein
MTQGLLHDAWEIRDEAGHLKWKDALHMDGDFEALLANPATFGGASAYGSLIYAGDKAARFLTVVREIAPQSETLRSGATSLRDLLMVRFLGSNTLELRDAFAAVWKHLRAKAGNLPPVLPRLWSI